MKICQLGLVSTSYLHPDKKAGLVPIYWELFFPFPWLGSQNLVIWGAKSPEHFGTARASVRGVFPSHTSESQ